MLLVLGIVLYFIYVILATKALLIYPKLRVSIGAAFLLVLFSIPVLPQVVIGRWNYNKWVTISSVLVLILALICMHI